MTNTTIAAAMLLVASAGPAGGTDHGGELVALVTAEMEACIVTDEVLREACARWGSQLPEAHRKQCDLPEQTFAVRTAEGYRAFREKNGAVWDKHADEAEEARRGAREELELRYAEVRAGKLSMLVLDGMTHEMNGRCHVLEQEWFVPR